LTLRIGTSGWVYNHWRGVFYPQALRQDEWLRHYALTFDTVEINNSFYRLPSAEAFERWREQAPRGFVYAVKASRFLTHMKKLKDPEEPIARLFERAAKLGSALGPVLYQFPPRWRLNLERFDYFLKALPADYQHVIEFRDASWLVEDAFRLMECGNVAHCIHDMHDLQIPLRVTSRTVYLRFHGTVKYGGDYSAGELKTWARRIKSWRQDGLSIFAYFNNDAGGYALKNAAALRALLGNSGGT
jgi:uncharacterized protein YecE (DUF72 family)